MEESTQLSDVPVPEKCTVSEVELVWEESILFDELLSEDCTDSEELVSEECTDSESDEDSQTVSEPDSESEEDSQTVSEPDSEAEVPNPEDLLSWVEEAVRSGFEDTAEEYTGFEVATQHIRQFNLFCFPSFFTIFFFCLLSRLMIVPLEDIVPSFNISPLFIFQADDITQRAVAVY